MASDPGDRVALEATLARKQTLSPARAARLEVHAVRGCSTAADLQVRKQIAHLAAGKRRPGDAARAHDLRHLRAVIPHGLREHDGRHSPAVLGEARAFLVERGGFAVAKRTAL